MPTRHNEIRLPWPPSVLSPNNRSHWRTKNKTKQKYKNDCFLLATGSVKSCVLESQINVKITFCPPDKRRRDVDNMLSSIKALLDAVADAWGVDDSSFVLTLERGPVVKGGAVVVEAVL